MRAVALLCALAATAATLVAVSTRDASASPAASRIVDRTLQCRVGYSNGARLLLITVR